MTEAPEDAAAARAAEQARLRKERREAKIKAGGAARLNKITGLGGGFQRDTTPTASPQPPSQSSTPPPQTKSTINTPSHHDDPEEVDISQHHYAPRTTNRPPGPEPSLSETQLRQMMFGADGTQPPHNPFLDASAGAGASGLPPGLEGMADDPMMKMLQQMMPGLGGAGAGGPNGGGGNPFAGTGMEGLFGAAAAAGGPQAVQEVVTDRWANAWRLLHAAFALGLGLYIASTTTFAGTKTEREFGVLAPSSSSSARSPIINPDGTVVENSVGGAGVGVGSDGAAQLGELSRTSFFYLFSSVEAVLLTTRYFLDKNRAAPSGVLWTLAGFLPQRVGGGVRHALRYAEILGTVRSDALVCVFVLGVCCWLRS